MLHYDLCRVICGEPVLRGELGQGRLCRFRLLSGTSPSTTWALWPSRSTGARNIHDASWEDLSPSPRTGSRSTLSSADECFLSEALLLALTGDLPETCVTRVTAESESATVSSMWLDHLAVG